MFSLPRLLFRKLAWLTPFLVLAWVLGEFVDESQGWMVLSAGLLTLLIIELRNFVRLARWATQPGVDRSLEGSGVWDIVFGQLYRHEKRQLSTMVSLGEEIERFDAAGHALIDGVVMLDDHNQIEWCNRMAEQQLGLRLKTDRGQSIMNLVRRPEFVEFLRLADFSRPLVMRSDRGERVLSMHMVSFAQNRRLMQIRDVTQANLLDQMRRDFVANVSHELRTPLTVLAGFVETLQEIELDAEERQRFLAMMGDQSQRMLAIVQDLLTLSSIESAPMPDSTPVDMATMLNKLQRDAEALSGGRHQIVINADRMLDLCGAENELVSAFTNLVANAVRYTPDGGLIQIIWQRRGDGAEFAVEDSGIGIDPKHIPRLTERFYRVDRGRSRDAGGTGLGLAIVKHTLQRHHGQLDITSQLGQGSRFAAVFPEKRVIASI